VNVQALAAADDDARCIGCARDLYDDLTPHAMRYKAHQFSFGLAMSGATCAALIAEISNS
jgi:hypothetical protein